MLGLLVILLISWGLLFLFEKKNLKVLGLVPTATRLSQYATGFLLMILILLSLILLSSKSKGSPYQSTN